MCPGNGWPESPKMKMIGRFNREATSEVLRGGGWKMLKQFGLTSDQIEDLVEQAKRDIANPEHRWFYRV